MVCASGETGWPHEAQHQHRGPEKWQASRDIFLYLHPLHPVQRSHALLLAEAWCGRLVGLNEPVSESAVRNEGLALMRAAELHTVATGKPPLGLGPSPPCLQHWCRQLGIDCIPPNGESLISSKFPRVPATPTPAFETPQCVLFLPVLTIGEKVGDREQQAHSEDFLCKPKKETYLQLCGRGPPSCA